MSGSSLDGLDIALCDFEFAVEPTYKLVDWSIRAGTTISYSEDWQSRLRKAPQLSAPELWRLHADLGRLFGQQVKAWLTANKLSADLLGSHGHTVFHDPSRGFTVQLGDGAQIAYAVGIPTVSELRSTDIAAGGQGAPIAPLADIHLFPDYEAFLNLGGIANVSLKTTDGGIVAGDISGANQILDRLAGFRNQTYDKGGQLASSGKLHAVLLNELQQMAFHQLPFPKSLDNGWVREKLWAVIDKTAATVEDKLHTFCHFLAWQIQTDLLKACRTATLPSALIRVLVTGGGARNDFMLRCLQQLPQDDHYSFSYEVADTAIGDLKEAALVALCALHRKLGIPNALATATGAKRDTINGALYLP